MSFLIPVEWNKFVSFKLYDHLMAFSREVAKLFITSKLPLLLNCLINIFLQIFSLIYKKSLKLT